MSELSSELQQLVHAGKAASQPSDADCERVYRVLEARLGLAGEAAILAVSRDGSRTLAFKTTVLVAVGAALLAGSAGLIHFLSQDERQLPEAAGVVVAPGVETQPKQTVDVVTMAPALPTDAEGAAPPAEQPMKVVTLPSPSHASSRPRDSLSDEVAILSRAERELHSGRAAQALQLLNEHERKYRNGLLAEERTAARIQALCALGRTAEANAQLARLAPKSLHGDSARQACSTTKKVPTGK